MTKPYRDPYVVLGVSPTATRDEIIKAYRDLAKKLHEDRLPKTATLEEKNAARLAFTHATEAYDRLMKSAPPKESAPPVEAKKKHSFEPLIPKPKSEFEPLFKHRPK